MLDLSNVLHLAFEKSHDCLDDSHGWNHCENEK